MISFFSKESQVYYLVQTNDSIQKEDISKLSWLFGAASFENRTSIPGAFIGPRKEMITPWSTNAVEITQNMGIGGIIRIEEFFPVDEDFKDYDPMLKSLYTAVDQGTFTVDISPEPILNIDDISAYNKKEGLALSQEEIDYLDGVSKNLGRKLTDSEVFGFSQVNSEHCRHKIFNGTFIIDEKEQQKTLFQMIKDTAKANDKNIVSAYKDNVAFIKGPLAEQFSPTQHDKPSFFETKDFESVISLKAETHNFPTTVEPFNGAATGAGGEIRDRMAGGQASFPLAGTAVYMTSYARSEKNRPWERNLEARKWLYQSPLDILIKASNGASDYGNKFGQPLICGSVLTFEHQEPKKRYGFDKVIMQAGGIGYGKEKNARKKPVEAGDKIVILGGDNYRIGMGGSAVSSVDTGEFDNAIELNAVQRANAEMQKRAAYTIRGMAEMDENPIISIHDHGAGGHLNCLSELIEDTGGVIDIDKLPVGDPTLSEKEIIGNESQERMGLVIKEKDLSLLQKVADRERSPIHVIGSATDDGSFVFNGREKGKNPVDWKLDHMFGSSPKTILHDKSIEPDFNEIDYNVANLQEYISNVLQLEAVACKDWLTNKVDRCVTGKVAKQQTTGEIQLPLNNVAVMALDFKHHTGIATSIGHACVPALINPSKGSILAIAEALTNLVWAPLEGGLSNVSLSANWMWPAKNEGENSRLYKAVKAASEFAIGIGVNIPTGKDSLSMTQKYPDGEKVYAPGTVIISSVGEVSDIRKVVEPVLKYEENTSILYIDFSGVDQVLGGSSFAQSLNRIGKEAPTVAVPDYFSKTFATVQDLIKRGLILAGHDISAGGIVTTLLEMNFPNTKGGLKINIEALTGKDIVTKLFSENPGIVIQVSETAIVEDILSKQNIQYANIGKVIDTRSLEINDKTQSLNLSIDDLRDTWYKSSHLLDRNQTNPSLADERFQHYKEQPLKYSFPMGFTGKMADLGLNKDRKNASGIKAAIIREKGNNSDREMAYMLWLAGFDVKDVHMTDLVSGREDLRDVSMITFVGGFSNSDVLGSAKGWAGAFLYNSNAKKALDNFYARPDTMSLGVCNGCQLMMELGLLFPGMGDEHPKMNHNDSGKFECTFSTVSIRQTDSIMLKSLEGSSLGIWSAHGEGKFILPDNVEQYNIAASYTYNQYPANPNGSDEACAAVTSSDGRHLAMMPHLERAAFPWNWPYYERKKDEITPWIEAFINAKKWIETYNQKQSLK